MSRFVSAFLAVAVIIPATTARAASDRQISPWLGITAGIGSCAMGDVNDEVRELNAVLLATMDEVTKCRTLGLGLGVDLTESWSISGNYLRLSAGTSVRDFTGALDYDLGANAIFASIEYSPEADASARFGIGVSGGLVMADGTMTASIVGVGAESGHVTGTGPYIDLYTQAQVPIGGYVAIVPRIGYRHAVARGVEVDGQPVYTSDFDRYDIDYSGAFVHLTVRLTRPHTPDAP